MLANNPRRPLSRRDFESIGAGEIPVQNYRTGDTFDLEKYLRTVGGTRPESFDWSDPGPRIDGESLFCLGYMLDIEAHTIINMRDLLSTSVVEEPSIAAFLSCWLYEEFSHSRTIARLLESQRVQVEDRHFAEIRGRKPAHHFAKKIAALIASRLTEHFPAIHMTWGAITELTAVHAYQRLIERAQHPLVTIVLSRIVKDERRHFSFYFNQARMRLRPQAARTLTSFALRKFWRPIGSPLRGDADTRRAYDHLFREQSGPPRLAQIDATMARLPGLEWFNLISQYCRSATGDVRPNTDLATAGGSN